MAEFIASLVLVSIGYLLGNFVGWMDYVERLNLQKDTKPIPPKKKSTLCQDYSHLKKKL